MGGKLDKAIERLKSLPKDYRYDEARALLSHLNFTEDNKGSTSGSRVLFHKGNLRILLHKPHPGNIMKTYQVKQLLAQLMEGGEIK